MKKILTAMLCILVLAVSASASVCIPTGAEYKDYSDWVDIGNATSESNHCAYGWDPTAGTPTDTWYGNRDRSDVIDDEGAGNPKDMKVVIKGSTECANPPAYPAYFILTVPTGYQATRLDLRTLDGIAGTDSFDVYVNDVFIQHVDDNDSSGGSEDWSTVSISLSNLEGQLNVDIVPTESAWSGCSGFGQITFSWAGITTEEKPEPPVPEFSAVAAGLALAGAATGFVLLRKRK